MKFIVILLIFAFSGLVQAEGFEYVGTNKCKTCHNKSKTGAQYKVWEKTLHAKAFEALLSEKALEIAKEMELKNIPSESAECLPCHTVGYGTGGYEVKDEAFYNPADDDRAGKKAAKRMENLKNIGCEACHGPGSKYKSKKVMLAIYNGETKGVDVGLNSVSKETCITCHNEKSPTSTEFNFDKMFAKIAHPIPETEEK